MSCPVSSRRRLILVEDALKGAVFGGVVGGVGGEERSLEVEPWTTLLDLLRERLDLTGTKKGCDTASAARARCSWTASASTRA